MNNRKIGKLAEDKAEFFLKSNNYNIIERNYHIGRIGEIDIICENDKYLVFLEVKSSQVDDFGNPVFKIGKKKQEQISLLAEIYLTHHPTDLDCRFDVIVIKGNQLVHYKDAFRT